jgi:hypothetical protein
MALNLSTLTSPATSGDVLAEALTTADFLESVPVLRNLARGSQKGGDAKQDVALNQPKALPYDGKGYLYLSGVSGNYASGTTTGELGGLNDVVIQVDDISSDWLAGDKRMVLGTPNINYFGLRVTSSRNVYAFFSETTLFNSNESKVSTASFSANDFDTVSIRVIRDTTAQTVTYFVDTGSGFTQLGDALSVTGATTYSHTNNFEIGSRIDGSSDLLYGRIGRVRVWPNTAMTEGSEIVNVDFTATNVRHGDTKFKCATGQVVTINQSGNDPATIIKKSVLRFDGANSGLRGLFNQTIDSGYMFAAFSVLGDGGAFSGRVFAVNSTGQLDSDVSGSGAIFSIQQGTDTNLRTYVNNGYRTIHPALFDDANGDILNESLIKDGTQLSRVNNADQSTTSIATSISAEEFSVASRSNLAYNTAIDLEFLALFPSSITDDQADDVRNYINNRNKVFDLKDGFGYYFFDAQNAPVGAITSGSSSWNGRIVGSDNGDSDRYLTQGTSNDSPVGNGYTVTFADNTDHLEIPSTTQAGWQVVGTSLGTFAYKVNANAVTELNLLGNLGSTSYRKAGDLYGIILLPESATGKDIEQARSLLIDRGAADGSATSSFLTAWFQRSDIVEFKPIDFSSVTDAAAAWRETSLVSFDLKLPDVQSASRSWQDCSSLESFSAELPSATTVHKAFIGCSSLSDFKTTDIKNCSNFSSAWQSCSSLSSFPAGAKLGTEADNVNFESAWRSSGLESFPALDLSNGNNFSAAFKLSPLTSFPEDILLGTNSTAVRFDAGWMNCSGLTSFPNIDLSEGRTFNGAWWYNTSLVNFPALFTNWSPSTVTSSVFNGTWRGCSSLSSTSVENILTSIDSSGVFGTYTGLVTGTALPDAGIDIDYNVATGSLSAATNSAIDSLSGKGWEVFINGVLVIPNILDLAPAAAYSLRSFDADADPNVVNVRRSSDNTTNTFKASEVSDGTLVAWVGAGNDGHVTTWYDQGGTNHANQSTASSQPKIVDGGTLVTEGGLAAVDFHTEASNLSLDHSDLYGQATLDSFYVTNATGDAYLYPSLLSTGNAYGMVAASTAGGGNNSTTISTNYGSPTFYANGTEITGTTRGGIYAATSGGRKLVGHQGADTSYTAWSSGSVNFGNFTFSATAFGYTGKLQEMIFFNTDQSANRTGIEKNINDIYTIY